MQLWGANWLSGCPRVSHPHNNVRDDFRPQIAPEPQFHRSTGTAASAPCPGTAGFGFFTAASGLTPLVPPGGSIAVRVPVRHHWSHADDPAVASRVGGQSSAPAVPSAALNF